jgi:hypothetical protein
VRDDRLDDPLRHSVRETRLPLESLQGRQILGAIRHNAV